MKTLLLIFLTTTALFSSTEILNFIEKENLNPIQFKYSYNPKTKRCDLTDSIFCDQKEGIKNWTKLSSCSVISHRTFNSSIIIDCLDKDNNLYVFGENERDCKRTATVALLNFKAIDSRNKKGGE